MTTQTTLPTTLHTRLLALAAEAAGFSASEVTGHSPAQVRNLAESLVKSGQLVRSKVTPRRVRYFASAELARNYRAAPPSRASGALPGGQRFKARWSADEEAIITPQTRIVIAPPLPRRVLRTSTYQIF